METIGKGVDAAGVGLMVAGILVASATAAAAVLRGEWEAAVYRRYRRRIGRAILLGLEILIAADIIRTVAVDPSFESAGVLAAIVLIRTFLSFALELELEGRWPWQARDEPGAGP